MISPKVIIKHRQILSLNSIDRKSKVIDNDKYLKNYVSEMIKYYSNPEKAKLTIEDFVNETTNINNEFVNMIIGYDSKNKKVIYAKNDDLESIVEDDYNCLKKSNLYQTIISFDNDWINQNINVDDLHLQMVSKILPKYFSSIGFDPQKITYQLSMHYDTHNLHYHLAFLEKQPAYKSRYSKHNQYRRKANISEQCDNGLKKMIQLRVEAEHKYNPLIKDIDSELQKIKNQFRCKENNYLLENVKLFRAEDKMIRLGKQLYDERLKKKMSSKNKISFGSIRNQEIITLTKQIKKELFDNNLVLKSEFDKAIEKFSTYIEAMNFDNNIKKSLNDYSMVEKKQKELDSFILNQIVNSSLYEYKKSLYPSKTKSEKQDFFIQEMAYKSYKNSKFKSRLKQMQNYINNKNNHYDKFLTYKGFNPINSCHAIKNLNYFIKRISSTQNWEVQRLRNQADINWYDKTKY